MIANWGGRTNYPVESADIAIIEELYNSGYEYIVDGENYQEYKAFEYQSGTHYG
jgi:hypothetical protein